jgi:hypothetical protein
VVREPEPGVLCGSICQTFSHGVVQDVGNFLIQFF